MRVTVRADEVKKGDVLFGHVVTRTGEVNGGGIVMLTNQYGSCFATFREDVVVEVERPEPTVTVTIELTPDQAEYARRYAGNGFGMVYTVMSKLGRALREETQA